MIHQRVRFLGVLLLATVVPAGAAAQQSREAIRMFVRAPGAADLLGRARHDNERVFSLASLPTTELEQDDVQYDQRFSFRGMRLRDLIARYGPPATVDTALLHFRNGIVIPLPFRDIHAMQRLDPFLAVAIRLGEKGWTRQFPRVSRENEEYYDASPTTFDKNKLVVKHRWHPSLPPSAEGVFSPWMYASSLEAIEFVQADAYFAQLDVEHTPETHHGFDLFRQNCAFCHGARGVGGKFGSDLVWPRPLYEYKRPFSRFYFHVTFRAPEAVQQGFMMPALSYMTQGEAHALWLWLQALARRNILPYQPVVRHVSARATRVLPRDR